MKIKKEYIVLAAVIIALVAYLALRKTDRIQNQLPNPDQVASKQISKLEITRPEGTVVLKKEGEKWTLDPQGYPADDQKVKDMIEILSDLSITAKVSESKNYARYELDKGQTISVKAWTGSKLGRELKIGKTASTFKHTFIKLPNDPNVYHALGNFKPKFDMDIDMLRDKTVLSFKPSEITEIHIRSDNKTVSFSKIEAASDPDKKDPSTDQTEPSEKAVSRWETQDGKSVDATKLDQILSRLSNLEGKSYIKDGKKEDYQNANYQITLKGTQTFTLSLFDKSEKDATEQPATSSENDYPFLLADFQIDGFKKIVQEILTPAESK